MKRVFFFYIFALLLEGAIYGANLAPVANMTSFEGRSTIKIRDGRNFPVVQPFDLYIGDTIMTGKNGKMQIRFLDNTAIRLGNHTTLSIVDYAFDEKRKSVASYAISNGVFTFSVGGISEEDPEAFKIYSPTASIGIRGSSGEAWVSDGSMGHPAGLKLSVMKGHVLEVDTVRGERFILHDPEVFLEIDEYGKVHFSKKTYSLFDKGFSQGAERKKRKIILIENKENALEKEFFHKIVISEWSLYLFFLPEKFFLRREFRCPFLLRFSNVEMYANRRRKNKRRISKKSVLEVEKREKEVRFLSKKERNSYLSFMIDWGNHFYKASGRLRKFLRGIFYR